LRLCKRRYYSWIISRFGGRFNLALFADIVVNNVLITLSIVILTATVFSLAGFINAVLAESFDDISIIPNLY